MKKIIFIILVGVYYFFWNFNVFADALYTLEGKADIFLVDNQGRQSGYKNGHEVEEIPGVSPEIMMGGSNEGRKQIYMPQRKDLKTVIVGRINEKYNLLIAGGNYFLKLDGIETKKGQIDEINSMEDSIEINFDDNKDGNYNLMMNNYKYKNGSIYYPAVKSTGDYQKYIINWEGVDKKSINSVKYTVKKDSVGNKNVYGIIFDDESISVKTSSDGFSKNISLLVLRFALILLIIFFYKNKITKKQFLILLPILTLLLGYFSYYIEFNNVYNKVDCRVLGDEIKEKGTDYDGDGIFEIKDGKMFIRDYEGSTLNYNLVPSDIDASTFKVISRGFSKDANNIYYWGHKINVEDYCSFKVEGDLFAKDKYNVYLDGKVLKNADVNTFEAIGSYYFKDKNHVYNKYGEVVTSADASTFTYNIDKYFAYDKNGVYIDDKTFIKGVDGKSFERIGNGSFYKDNSNVYNGSSILELADASTFEVISYEYYKDKNHIYDAGGNIMKGLDINSYGYTELNSIIYDKNGVYPDKDIYLAGADGKSFVDLGYGYYKDKNKVYFKVRYYGKSGYEYVENTFDGIDVDTFRVFKGGSGYATDGNKLYFNGTFVTEGIDISKCTGWYDCFQNYPYKK